MKKDVVLSTGRVIGHRPFEPNGEQNGATEAFVRGGGEMTHEEWAEYCKILHSTKTD